MKHIPKNTTSDMDILSFHDALTIRGTEEYDRNKWFYVPDTYCDYRYILGTKGQNPLICIGVNPSTAAPGALDPTLKSVERIQNTNGFDSFYMINLYPQRATDPMHMERECNKTLCRENEMALEFLLNEVIKGPATVWCAWGTIIEKRPYLSDCLKGLVSVGKKYNVRWVDADKRSKVGHPHHPLYMKADSIFRDFDVEEYLNSI
ncbi:hypothetical protein M2145_001011 [Lachnospiraceae bacterium PF1-21]|uniref:DUF1643 domain-containing protein n=1 Tax=Ohessyouella blattaphilus TaxID=2949333 RepID=UPI003E276DBF